MSDDGRWGDGPAEDVDDGDDLTSAADASLTVQVDGHRRTPTLVYVLTRSRGALVEVREFRPGCAPVEYTATAHELLAVFARAERDRRRMSESMYAIRGWLGDGA